MTSTFSEDSAGWWPLLQQRIHIAQANGENFPLSVSLLSWGYNEEENITEFLRLSKTFMDSLKIDYEHILIDDASTDRTFEFATIESRHYPQLRIIRNERNMNSGWNTRIAIHASRKDILFWQTVDWAYDISQMREYLWALGNNDVVQGIRCLNVGEKHWFNYIPGLKKVAVAGRSDNATKAFISVMNYSLIRFLFRVPLLDYQNVTVYPTRLAQSIDCESSSSFTNPELVMKAYWKGCRIVQVPIGFLPRQKGEAKGTRWPAVLKSIRQIWGFWFRWIFLGKLAKRSKGQVQVAVSDTRLITH